ncbi:MAG: carboxypeptidase regulatory-like domain-containing protein [Clostridia bacterium]|nr:carboxypeptidase regulatory-like domain-containing protein [Clostridia bacterium]
MNYSDDFREMIKMYNEELKKAQQKSKPVAQVVAQPVQSQEEKAPFEFTNTYNLPTVPQSEIIKGQTGELTGEGYLIVKLVTRSSAAPVVGGSVLVSFDGSTGETLVKSLVSDRNGETEKISLPTVTESESQSPGVNNPYASYSIRASKDGYFTIDSVNVPIFDKQTAVQNIEMIPLPEDYQGKTVLQSNDTGSITLN